MTRARKVFAYVVATLAMFALTASQSGGCDMSLSKTYRDLVKRYKKIPASELGAADAAKLREEISHLCRRIKKGIPLGSSQRDVIMKLGVPAVTDNRKVEESPQLLYLGDSYSWFHVFVFRDRKLVDHYHTRILDLEGGR